MLALLLALAAPPLVPVHDVPLPGAPGRFDYQWVDAERRRLYVAHLGAGELLAIDLDAERVVGTVRALPAVHGVVAAPAEHRLFATITGEKALAIIDDRTFEVVARVPAGEYPNGLAYAPAQRRVYVSSNTGTGVGVVDAASATARPGIDIGGGAGNTQYDPASGHVFAAIHRVAALAEIDPASDRVVARHPLPAVRGCHGLVIDGRRRLALAACDGRTLIAYALDERRVLGRAPTPREPDVLAIDGDLGRAYVACESGFVAAYAIGERRTLRRLGEVRVDASAHTVAVDPRTHRLLLPLADVGGRPVLRIMAPAP